MARSGPPPTREDRDGGTAVVAEPRQKVEKPRMFKVLLHNDDYTTMEFVVMVLMSVFHHPKDRAVQIMLAVHHQGLGEAGVYPYEVAETKVARVTSLARQNDHPLRCSMEPE